MKEGLMGVGIPLGRRDIDLAEVGFHQDMSGVAGICIHKRTAPSLFALDSLTLDYKTIIPCLTHYSESSQSRIFGMSHS